MNFYLLYQICRKDKFNYLNKDKYVIFFKIYLTGAML